MHLSTTSSPSLGAISPSEDLNESTAKTLFSLLTSKFGDGPKNTRELAVHFAQAKSFDSGDAAMVKMVGQKIIHMLRMRAKQKQLIIPGKTKGVITWRLPNAEGL